MFCITTDQVWGLGIGRSLSWWKGLCAECHSFSFGMFSSLFSVSFCFNSVVFVWLCWIHTVFVGKSRTEYERFHQRRDLISIPDSCMCSSPEQFTTQHCRWNLDIGQVIREPNSIFTSERLQESLRDTVELLDVSLTCLPHQQDHQTNSIRKLSVAGWNAFWISELTNRKREYVPNSASSVSVPGRLFGSPW